MKSALRLVALVVIVAASGWWLAAGANRGWTKTSVPVKSVDEVTGLEGTTYQKKFIPGVDLLAVVVAGGLLCAGLSFLFRTKPAPQTSNE